MINDFVLVRYKTLKKLINEYDEDFFKDKTHNYFDRKGKYCEITSEDFVKSCKRRGIWGFMVHYQEGTPSEIHFWADEKKVDFKLLMRFLSHELGHCQEPHYDYTNKEDKEKEEAKANTYEDVTETAYLLAKDILSEDTKFKADN